MELLPSKAMLQTAPINAASSSPLNRVASGSVLIFTSMFFGLGLNYVYSISLARMLDAEIFGLYTLGLAAFNVLSVVSVAGLDRAILRFIPAENTGNSSSSIGHIAKHIAGMSLVIGCVVGLVLFGFAPSLSSKVFGRPELTSVLGAFSLAIPLFALSTVLLSTLQALQDNRWRSFVKYGCEPVIKFSITVAFVGLGWGISGALAGFIISLFLTVVLAYVPIRHYVASDCSSFESREFYKSVFRFTAPLLGALIIASLANRSDVFLLGYWLQPEQIGFYSAAFQTASIIALILGSFDSVATPLISRAIASGHKADLELLLQSVLRWSVTISLPAVLILVLFPAEVLSIFGDKFSQASHCLVVLAASQIISAVSGSSNTALVLGGYSRIVLWNSIWLGLIQIGLNVLLVPSYGITGAAIGTALALALVSLVRLYECTLLLKVKVIQRDLWKPAVAAVITFWLGALLKHSGISVSWWIIAAASAFLYLLIVALFGLRKEDRDTLIHFKRAVCHQGGP